MHNLEVLPYSKEITALHSETAVIKNKIYNTFRSISIFRKKYCLLVGRQLSYILKIVAKKLIFNKVRNVV